MRTSHCSRTLTVLLIAISTCFLSSTLCRAQVLAPTQVAVMPGYPNAPKLMPEEKHFFRPGGPVCVWGNANGGVGLTSATATYQWSFSANQNLMILTDGDLTGVVTNDRFICEVVTFNLTNGSTRETVAATLTVSDGANGVAARTVEILVIDPSDPQSNTPLTNLQVDVNIAIESALRSLYLNANLSMTSAGDRLASWDNPNGPPNNNGRAASAFALWAFQNQGHLPRPSTFSEDIYASTVAQGLESIFSMAGVASGTTATDAPRATMALGATMDTVSDLNGNGQVVFFDSTNRRGYASPIVCSAIVASGSPDRVVNVGPLAGMTYRTVVEDAIDWLGANQNAGGASLASWSGRGGWDYGPSSSDNRSDMSINSWAYVALEGAVEVFNIDVPDWMRQEIEYGLVRHQATDGRFGYTGTSSNGVATTGGGLSGLALVETAQLYAPGTIFAQWTDPNFDTLSEKRAAAIADLGARWGVGNNSVNQTYSSGNRGNFYAMWTVARSLRLTASALGLSEGAKVPLVNSGVMFDWETGEEDGTGVLAATGTTREGHFPYLLRTQTLNTPTVADVNYGSWNGWYGRTMCTAMGALILTPRVFSDACPAVVTIPLAQLSPTNNSSVSPGTTITFSGRAVPQDTTRPVLGVFVNGAPVDSLDAAGNFFKSINVQAGANTLIVRAVDRCGASEIVHVLNGGNAQTNLSNFSDVTVNAALRFTNTTYNQQTGKLIASARAENISQDIIDAPLVAVLDNITQPGVVLDNPDGFTPEGKPYVVFVNPAVSARLMPGEFSAPRVLIFDNPAGVPLLFSNSWIAPANSAPYFGSIPAVSAAVGAPYAYAARAQDPESDPLTYEVEFGPVGLSINSLSGDVSWTPQTIDLGSHSITLVARDGRGGVARQSFVLQVAQSLPNGPPFFTSVPQTQSAVNASLSYLATAVDPDNDTLSFSLVQGPSGAAISSAGQLTWPQVAPGLTLFTLRVEDPSGAYAEQSFNVAAGVASTNPNAPRILSFPSATAVVNQPYFYQPVAVDPDPGQTVSWSLVSGPTGMIQNPVSGLVTWSPGSSQLGQQAVEIRADDGNGGVTAQGWTIDVSIAGPNQAPVFSTTPQFTTDIGLAYTYDAEATDPEGEEVNYSLLTSPSGMMIDSLSGIVTWMPATLGNYSVTVRATDDSGLSAHQSFTLQVLPPNQAPTITSTAPANGAVGATYRYQVTVTDPDPDPHTYSLLQSPVGMSIDMNSGLVLWMPVVSQVPSAAVTVQVSDGRGGLDTQSFTVSVIQDTEAPQLQIIPTPNPAAINSSVRVCVQAGDNVGVVNRTLTIDGQPAVLDQFGCASFVPVATGMITLVATASDASGNVGSTTEILLVGNPAQGAPMVQILAPLPGVDITAPTDIVATISDPSGTQPPPLVSWEVRLRNLRTNGTRTLATGNSYVTNGTLATVDPTLLCNDGYVVEVLVNNVGFGTMEPLPITVSGSLKLGNFTTEVTDLSIPVAGVPITISRQYNSLDTSVGDFGHGWRLGINARVDDVPLESPEEPFLAGISKVYVTLPNGDRIAFTIQASPVSPFFPFFVNLTFVPESGQRGTLEALDDTSPAFIAQGVILDGLFSLPWNPSRYRYTSPEGVQYDISEETGLERVEDITGNTVTVLPSGIVSSTGVSLTFLRDAEGRITQIVEPQAPGATTPPATLNYSYDAAGNLVGAMDQTGATTTYTYEATGFPHYLTGINDPLGRPTIRNVFNSEGRIVAQCGPEGNPATLEGCTLIQWDTASLVQTFFNARGFRTDLVLDDRGNILAERKWDANQQSFREQSFMYDADNNLLSELDGGGNARTYTYDANGNMLSRTEPNGTTFLFAYDGDDNLIQTTDVAGNTTTFNYDAQGRLTDLSDPLGGVTQYQYNSLGLTSAIVLPGNRSWSFGYNNQGFLTSITDPASQSSVLSWTMTGDLEYTIDRNGKRIDFTYDAAHRIASEVWSGPNPRRFQFRYNAGGQLTLAQGPSIDEVQRYDRFGRLSATIVEATGGPLWQTSYAYDANGNVAGVSDSQGGNTLYGYDAWDRLTQVASFVDSEVGQWPEALVRIGYDQAGLVGTIERESSMAGTQKLTTTLGYDCGGCNWRLTSIQHATASTTLAGRTLTRDPVGLITGFTDSSGAHGFSYDGAGRLLSATHPAASGLPNESYSYDALGNRSGSHLSAGMVYDVDNRLTSDGTYSYTYDNEGNVSRRTVILSGDYLEFEYDHRNRPERLTFFASGGVQQRTLSYIYDAAGRKVGTNDQGVQTWSLFDGENELAVLDAQGQLQERRILTRYVDNVLGSMAPNDLRWYLTDQVSSVVAVADGSLSIANRTEYDSFGRIVSELNPSFSDPLKFQSRSVIPGTTLMDFRARILEPGIGRFLAEDPALPFGYGFGEQNPLIWRDPTGTTSISEYAKLTWNIIKAQPLRIGLCIAGTLGTVAAATLDPYLAAISGLATSKICGGIKPPPPTPPSLPPIITRGDPRWPKGF